MTVALALMLATLAASLGRAVLWPAHVTVPYAEWVYVGIIAVSWAINGGFILAVALRQRWAAVVYGVLVLIGVPVIALHVAAGEPAGGAFANLVFAAAEITAACLLLLTPSAREWFAAGRPSDKFPPRWHPDPTGRHQYRYWDGASWTAYVVDYGAQSIDPLPPVAPA